MLIPYTAPAELYRQDMEIKKSIFITHILPVNSEEEAQQALADLRKKYKDATHNCYAYVIGENAGVMRYSDDGEPGGTAGMPVLQVLQREGMFNILCVVTRYFGGTLLGAGGLVRAYAHSAKLGLDAAGRSIKQVWTRVLLPCPYSWYERVKLEVPAFGGVIDQTDFGAEVTLELLLPKKQAEPFLSRIFDLSSGTIEGLPGEDEYRAFPVGQEA